MVNRGRHKKQKDFITNLKQFASTNKDKVYAKVISNGHVIETFYPLIDNWSYPALLEWITLLSDLYPNWDSIYLNDYRFDFKKLRNESRKT